MDCGTCPWGPYPRKSMTAEQFETYAEHVKKILGYKPMQKPCVTCQTPDKDIPKGSRLPPRNCLVRQCVDKTCVENCAYCSRFPCGHVKDTSGAWNRKKFEEKLGAPLSEEDYRAFVEPFEALQRLETLRVSVSPNQIVDAFKVEPLKPTIVDFPKELVFSKDETAAFHSVHKLLTSVKRSPLGLTDVDTFAQQQRLKKRTPQFLRFLWILARFGQSVRNRKGFSLTVDAKAYMSNRGSETTLAVWPYVEKTVFQVLQNFGVQCERVALEGVNEKDLTVPTGYMRSKGWFIKMSFDEKAGGTAALKALQTYAKKLDEEYGKKAFRYFSDVDMRVLG